MAKTLILMRHGKAVAASPNQDDFDRELSEAGKRALIATLPYSLSMLEAPGSEVEILSSPAPRAMQTARLLEKAIKSIGFKTTGDITECTELWYQDADGFMDFVASRECKTIFAVGHNPFVEDHIATLTGAQLPCATGALACIALDMPATCSMAAQGAYAHRLLWFAQGPQSQRWKTLVTFESILRNCANEMLERREAFLDDPDDIETMHKFRVSIRTLRSLVAFIKPWQQSKQNEQLQSLLKATVAHTSRLRELDVFADQAGESETASSELIAFCDDEARSERERVKSVLTSKECTKDVKRAVGLSRNIVWKSNCMQNGLSAKDVRAHFDGMVNSLESQLANLKLSDVERTHDVRKRAKRVRYVAEKFKGVIGNDAVGIAKGMTAYQDNLGAVCDARVNIDLINDFIQRDLPERVSWDLALIRAQNETFLYNALKQSE